MHITVWDTDSGEFVDADSGIHKVLPFTRRELVGKGWVNSGLLSPQQLAEGTRRMQAGGLWQQDMRGHTMVTCFSCIGHHAVSIFIR